MRKPILIRAVLAAILLVFVGLAVTQARQQTQLNLRHNIELHSKEAKLIELDNKYTNLLQDKSQTLQEKTKKIEELEKQKAKLEKDLQAKLNNQSKLQTASLHVLNGITGTRTASAQTPPKNGYKAFIYQHESGNRLGAVNSRGCIGLGQSCGGSLAVACPNWRTNRICQDKFWDNYAIARYGGWEQSYQFWVKSHWW